MPRNFKRKTSSCVFSSSWRSAPGLGWSGYELNPRNQKRVSTESRKLLYIVAGLARPRERSPWRLVLPSCTALPLAAWPLFTRSLANQRSRSGAWTPCAPGWVNSACAPLPGWEEGAEGCGAASWARRKEGRKEDLPDSKVHPGPLVFGGWVQTVLGRERRFQAKRKNVFIREFLDML